MITWDDFWTFCAMCGILFGLVLLGREVWLALDEERAKEKEKRTPRKPLG